MILVMPENQSLERRQSMRAFGAELVLTPEGGRHGVGARHRRARCATRARASSSTSSRIPTIRWRTTAAPGPEIWRDTDGAITHFVSAMGTTGTIMGVSRYPQGEEPGDPRSSARSRPKARRYRASASGRRRTCRRSTTASRVDRIESVTQAEAEETTRRLAREEGIFCGISAGGACAVALRIAREVERRDDRVHRLRPRRPLPVDRCLPRLTCARRPRSAHDADPRLRHRDRARRRRPAARRTTCRADARRRRRARLGGRSSGARRPAATSCRCTSSAWSRSAARCAKAPRFKVASVGSADDAEPELIRRFFDLIDKLHAAARVVERRRLRPAGAATTAR